MALVLHVVKQPWRQTLPRLAAPTSSPCWVSRSTSAWTRRRESNQREHSTRQAATLPMRLVQATPTAVQPYLRLARADRPIGSWLLFWPCGWSLAMAAPAGCWPDPLLLSLFGLGAVVMRGAGCTINDLWDRDIDGKVERTRDRPLASGVMHPLDAVAFLSAQLSLGLAILLQLNWPAVVLGMSSLGLVFIYPAAKRFTNWPQLVLGLTFNWGALLGWCAARGSLDASVCFPLYAAGICWTLLYDTIYAHQDTDDDVELGIFSTALHFGEDSKKWLTGFASAMMAGLLVSGACAGQTWPYYAAVLAVGAHASHQVSTLKMHDPSDCSDKFRSNRALGATLFLGIVLGTYLKASEDGAKTKTTLRS